MGMGIPCSMAYNMYKQIGKIKNELEEKGYKKDIPYEVFGKTLMILFGMRKKKALEWIDTFADVDLIIIDDDIVNFKEE